MAEAEQAAAGATTATTASDGNAEDSQQSLGGRDTPEGDAFPTAPASYDKVKLIGRGAFAEVWKATVKESEEDELVAIKILNLENMPSSSGFDEILQEVQTMRMCNHENVLGLHTSFINGDELWLVTRLMDKGSLMHVMRVAKHMGLGEGFREPILEYVLREVLKGMKYIHDQGYIHRDIKAGNILVSAEGHVRVADFGVSGWLVDQGFRKRGTKTFVGTPCWMAPEVMEQESGYDNKADIWSFGITALELAKGHAPYARYPPMTVLLKTIKEEPPSLKTYEDDKQVNGENFTRGFKEMIRLCLQKDPARRPTTTTLLTNKFFKSQQSRDMLVTEILGHMPDVGNNQPLPNDERHPDSQMAEEPLRGRGRSALAETDDDIEAKDGNGTLRSSRSVEDSVGDLPEKVQKLMDQNPGVSNWDFTPMDKSAISAATDDDDIFDELEQIGDNPKA